MDEHRQITSLIFGEGGSAVVVGATFLGWLPDVAAVFAIAWYAVQIWDRFRKKG